MVFILGDLMVMKQAYETLDESGCGYTVDSFKFGDNGQRAIQWVVARPTSLGKPDIWPPLKGLLKELPAEHNLELGLTNSSADLAKCPFQPKMCLGAHHVASGVGYIS
jgi:hypothetical protein